MKDRSLVVNIDLLEAKLNEIPRKLEALVQSDRVLRKEELARLLESELNVREPDKSLLLHFLEKMRFIRRKRKRDLEVYIVGARRPDKIENYEIDMKATKMGKLRMEQKKHLLAEEVARLLKKAKTVKDEKAQKRLKMECVSKAKIVGKLKKQILILEQRIAQSSNLQDDVIMANLMRETELDTGELEEVTEVLAEQMNLQREIADQQSQLDHILNAGGRNDQDCLDEMFNALDAGGEVSEEFEKVYQESEVRLRDSLKLPGEPPQKVMDPPEKQGLARGTVGAPADEPESKKIFGVEDVLKYHEQRHGKLQKETTEVVYENNRKLIFKSSRIGQEKERQAGQSFGEYKKQKSLLEQAGGDLPAREEEIDFDGTFQGTNVKDSSGRGLSDFTVNRTVSHLDERKDSKNLPRSMIEETLTSNAQFDNRNAISTEKETKKLGLLQRVKNTVFGSDSKTWNNSEASLKNQLKKLDEEVAKNEYAVDFDQVRAQTNKPQLEIPDLGGNAKGDREPKTKSDQKLGIRAGKPKEDSMVSITKPSDISILNLTKKKKKLVFQSPETKKGKDNDSKKSVRKSTGKPLTYKAWGKNTIIALKKELNN